MFGNGDWSLTCVGFLLLALLRYGFRAEVWPHHPAVGGWSLGLLLVLVVVGLLQLLRALPRWLLPARGGCVWCSVSG